MPFSHPEDYLSINEKESYSFLQNLYVQATSQTYETGKPGGGDQTSVFERLQVTPVCTEGWDSMTVKAIGSRQSPFVSQIDHFSDLFFLDLSLISWICSNLFLQSK